jgi:hypothetical protein
LSHKKRDTLCQYVDEGIRMTGDQQNRVGWRIAFWSVLAITIMAGALIISLRPIFLMVQERNDFCPRFNEHHFCLRAAQLVPGDQASVSWLRKVMGDSPVPTLVYSPELDKDGSELRRVRRLFPEATIWGWQYSKQPLPEGIRPIPQGRRIII